MTGTEAQAYLDLVDWRRRVGDLYRISGPDALKQFRQGRDELFRSHPQSPIEPDERPTFAGCHYFEPDPTYRVTAHLEPGDASELAIDTGGATIAEDPQTALQPTMPRNAIAAGAAAEVLPLEAIAARLIELCQVPA